MGGHKPSVMEGNDNIDNDMLTVYNIRADMVVQDLGTLTYNKVKWKKIYKMSTP